VAAKGQVYSPKCTTDGTSHTARMVAGGAMTSDAGDEVERVDGS